MKIILFLGVICYTIFINSLQKHINHYNSYIFNLDMDFGQLNPVTNVINWYVKLLLLVSVYLTLKLFNTYENASHNYLYIVFRRSSPKIVLEKRKNTLSSLYNICKLSWLHLALNIVVPYLIYDVIDSFYSIKW